MSSLPSCLFRRKHLSWKTEGSASTENRRFEVLVQAGLSNLEALEAATLNPAIAFDREKDLGTIEQGKLADFVLLDATRSNALTTVNILIQSSLLRACSGGAISAV
jgi:imidazolonepropionase-like amidohydrolase